MWCMLQPYYTIRAIYDFLRIVNLISLKVSVWVGVYFVHI